MIDINRNIINLSGFAESEMEDVRRCLETLLSVREGEQPLDRNFGIKNSFLDKPMNIAKNLFTLEIIDKIKRYEKRAEVAEIDYQYAEDGQMIPVIYIKKRGEIS